MKEKDNVNFVCVLRTGRLWEHDLAAHTLKESRIPFCMQRESSSGLRQGMLLTPVMGPGNYFNILVPEEFTEKAKQLLSELPIDLTVDPDPLHFTQSEKARAGWRIVARIALSIIIMQLLIGQIMQFRR